jgi:uncharacterized protein with von Willebrand factor type A (vWA) domain
MKVGDLVKHWHTETGRRSVALVVKRWGEFLTLSDGAKVHWSYTEVVSESR